MDEPHRKTTLASFSDADEALGNLAIVTAEKLGVLRAMKALTRFFSWVAAA